MKKHLGFTTRQCSSTSRSRLLAPRARSASTCVALGVVLAGVISAAPAARALTDKEEVALSRGLNEAVAQRMGGILPASDPMSQRVERIGRRFAHLARARSFGYRYRVLRSNSILNAFAAPGGTIYITQRLVKFARSDDELASILGHETAHVSQRHIAQEVDERNAFVRFSARLNELRRQAAQGSVKSAAKPTKAIKSTASASLNASESSPWPTMTWWLLSRGRSRALESEADVVSARWMKRLGYNPRAAISLLQHVSSTTPSSSSPLASLLASHPGMPERIVALRELIAREKLDQNAKPATNSSSPKAAPLQKSAPLNAAPTTATADVAAAAAAGHAPPSKPTGEPVLP